jgi:hypothetical protein
MTQLAAQLEAAKWNVKYRVDKFNGHDIGEYRERYGKAEGERRFFEEFQPDETIEKDGNLLVTAGITALLNLLIGAGGTAFNNANSYLGVGDSSTAAAIGQTDLQASTNKLRKAMDATFPSVATNVVTFKSTFATGDANFAWAEWATFNASTAGTMLNRKVESLGTKTSAASWALTITITIS